MTNFADDNSRKTFRTIADSVEAANPGGTAILDLEDGRIMTVLVIHTDKETKS